MYICRAHQYGKGSREKKRRALEQETKIRCFEERRAGENERLAELIRNKLIVTQEEPVIADLTPVRMHYHTCAIEIISQKQWTLSKCC